MSLSRTDFIDRLRVTLTAWVVLHHTAITYGGSGGWFYREPGHEGVGAIVLTLFCAVNQAFFMGMFFLIAGYFTPGSLRRKGAATFLRERLLRLGVPLLVFGFVFGPLSVAWAGVTRGEPWFSAWLSLLRSGRFEMGPLWFALALLIFAAGTCVLLRARAAADATVPRNGTWLLAALGVGLAALLIRQLVPVGQTWAGLQLGYFASYVFLFALGVRAADSRWLERIAPAQARIWFGVSLVAIPALLGMMAASGALEGKPVEVSTGWGFPTVFYAFWEPLVAWGLIAALLTVAQARFNRPSARWSSWSAQAYGAFVVHAPVLVGISVLLRGWEAPGLLKFSAVGCLATVASFLLARLLLKIPGASRIL